VLINPAGIAAIADGVIVNAAWAVGQMATRPRASRRTSAGMDLAGWMDTERLTREGLPGARLELPGLTDAEATELGNALKRDEVQGALQALLAARLTDAPEADAAQAREVLAARVAACDAVRLAFGGAVTSLAEPTGTGAGKPERRRSSPRFATSPDEAVLSAGSVTARYAAQLSEYFDDKISALVAMLEGRVGRKALAQARSEAYSARIVALLGAIERQVAALADPACRTPAEAEFLERYRRQAHQRHGFLTPPDFDRRRRVSVDDIYVPTEINEEDYAERTRVAPEAEYTSLKVWDLVGRLDRTVLLGDPGGGKTTAANVLTDYFASGSARKVPFLVTLREYAAMTPIEWSVAGCIEQSLTALYQSPAPDGLVERLLLTGRAVVIFDGLDELLDTSRRRDVSDRVEQFCSAYPLTPVLVTSRAAGYDQARLDDAQFTCYRLGGFGDHDVAEYARKWFTTQEGVAAAEASAKARAFVDESANAKDLRGNPLLLSLMCILYRGAGSLPGDRAGIYARCAELLLRKWDQQRDLYRRVNADHLVEPAIRYLAWWLFGREDSRAETTERQLGAKAAEFLLGRGYESEAEALAAAQEFIDFCRGRMWVFSEVGTTASGEKLYAFTHRTFMEYFAAGHLAATSDTPEKLAQAIAPNLEFSNWQVIGELAIQIKQSGTDRAADRIYATILDQHSYDSLLFLVNCTSSARPSPATVRRLTCAILDYAYDSDLLSGVDLLTGLIIFSPRYEAFIHDEFDRRTSTMIASGEESTRKLALRFLLETIDWLAPSPLKSRLERQADQYAAEILDTAARDSDFRVRAVSVGAISIEQALAMPGDLSVLFEDRALIGHYEARLAADEETLMESLAGGDESPIHELAAIGRFLVERPQLPWVRASLYDEQLPLITVQMASLLDMLRDLDEATGLGLAAAIAIGIELSDLPTSRQVYRLSKLPMPVPFRKLFRDWAVGDADFVKITNK
jgi:hypothetical protein